MPIYRLFAVLCPKMAETYLTEMLWPKMAETYLTEMLWPKVSETMLEASKDAL